MIRLVILASLVGLAAPALAQTVAKPCEARVLQDKKVLVCTFDPARHTIRTLWKDKAGAPYGSLGGIASAPTGEKAPLAMAMNAGMYHQNLDPVGLYIERGETLKTASTAGGPGNFHLRPNGVFHVAGGAVGVTETRRFLASKLKPEYASQSGPMLVIDGRLHPAFTGRGQSEKVRNGVGVAAGGKTVFFVISEEPLTFTAFARIFRDDLKARNALYFDGSISSIYAPSVNRADRFMPVGPIVAVYPR